jgi:DNA polymerase phi
MSAHTLALFNSKLWSPNAETRLEAASELVNSLSQGDDPGSSDDVPYSLKRLVRGLASPRESSRIGFAVALTEVRVHLLKIIQLAS